MDFLRVFNERRFIYEIIGNEEQCQCSGNSSESDKLTYLSLKIYYALYFFVEPETTTMKPAQNFIPTGYDQGFSVDIYKDTFQNAAFNVKTTGRCFYEEM